MWQLQQLSVGIAIFLTLFTSLSISTSTFDIESERVCFQGFWSDVRSMNRMILMLYPGVCPLSYFPLSLTISSALSLCLSFGHVIKLRCEMQILWKMLELSLLFFYTLSLPLPPSPSLFPSPSLSYSLLPFALLLVY